MALQASGQIDFSDINVELGRSGTAALSLGTDAGARALAAVGTVGTAIRLGADFYSKASTSLLATTPGGYVTTTSNEPSDAVAFVEPHIDGYLSDSSFGSTAYMSATGTNYASGKYWKWNYVSGDTPSSPTQTEDTWTACGTGGVHMRRLGTAGTRQGIVAIKFANDASGTGATTAGNWELVAVVEI